MKKLICSLVVGCLVLYVISAVAITGTNAEDDMYNKGTIYVNNVEVINEATTLVSDNEMFIPLRTVLEALESTVTWEESTGNIYFDFKDQNYICKLRKLERENFPPLCFIQICKVENKDSINNADYIQLHPMSADGSYCMINDRTYLYPQTGQRLLEALGCTVEMDMENNILKINSNQK